MPYAIAHPLAVIPLARAMGRRAVASALVIGSIVPDAWYLVPGLDRALSHNPSGLFLFCLPAGLLAYVLFHRVLKEPLLHLFPQRLAARVRAFACTALPAASWLAVCVSLVLGAATHLVWDAFTHRGRLSRLLPFLTEDILQVLQHGSTIAGFAVLAWWTVGKLRGVAPVEASVLGARLRCQILLALAATAVIASGAALAAVWPTLEPRLALRIGAVSGASTLGIGILVYALLFRRVR